MLPSGWRSLRGGSKSNHVRQCSNKLFVRRIMGVLGNLFKIGSKSELIRVLQT
jgi:hypothetical protein